MISDELPAAAPLMVLPGTTLFPKTLLPLFIFEPRYRAMLAWALERERCFCIATMKPGVTEATHVSQFHHISSIGFIRACVGHDDGTSHLLLQGIRRVRFSYFVQDTPFRIAGIDPLLSTESDPLQSAQLAAALRQRCAKFVAVNDPAGTTLEEHLQQLDDHETLCDVIAHSFVTDPEKRQALLEELDITARLRTLLTLLQEAEG